MYMFYSAKYSFFDTTVEHSINGENLLLFIINTEFRV